MNLPRSIGLLCGVVLFLAYLFLTAMAAQVNIGDILTGLVDLNSDVPNAGLYIVSGGLFLFTVATIVIFILEMERADYPDNPVFVPVGCFLLAAGGFAFVCFPLTLLSRNFPSTLVLIGAPFLGIFAGREIAKRARERIILNAADRRELQVTFVVSFVILVGLLQFLP